MGKQAVTDTRRETVAARALAVVLRPEFDTDFRVYDSQSGVLLWPDAADVSALSVDRMELQHCAETRRVSVSLHEEQHVFQLMIPQTTLDDIQLVAVGAVPIIGSLPSDVSKECERLERWGNSVCERLLQADQLHVHRQAEDDLRVQAKHAWELNLRVERVIRDLRVHRDVEVGIHEILEAAAAAIDAEALIWLPQHGEQHAIQAEPIMASYDIESLVETLRKLPELRDRGACIIEETSTSDLGRRYPAVSSVMIFAVPHLHPVGWLVALNKKLTPDVRSLATTGRVAFRRRDAAALASFVALLGTLIRTSRRHQDMKELLVGLTRSLASAVDAKDPYTYGHSERVARISIELGQELELSEDQLSDLYLAGLLHDVGKIGVRDDVLRKQGPLTLEEAEHMRKHPEIGHSILKNLRQISSVLPGVLHHHEQFNGEGYPHSLAGDAIPLIARILAVADSYDAMSTTRPYRQALSPAKVEQILTDGAGEQWDPRVIAAFKTSIQRIRSIRERGLGESLRQALDGALRDTDRRPGVRMANSLMGEFF